MPSSPPLKHQQDGRTAEDYKGDESNRLGPGQAPNRTGTLDVPGRGRHTFQAGPRPTPILSIYFHRKAVTSGPMNPPERDLLLTALSIGPQPDCVL